MECNSISLLVLRPQGTCVLESQLDNWSWKFSSCPTTSICPSASTPTLSAKEQAEALLAQVALLQAQAKCEEWEEESWEGGTETHWVGGVLMIFRDPEPRKTVHTVFFKPYKFSKGWDQASINYIQHIYSYSTLSNGPKVQHHQGNEFVKATISPCTFVTPDHSSLLKNLTSEAFRWPGTMYTV